jgi:hypothetical protein
MMTKGGSNWTFTRGIPVGVVTRAAANGRTVHEVQIRLPRGGPARDDEQVTLPLMTWNDTLGAQVAAVPPGTEVMCTGHLAARSWVPTSGGPARLSSEVILNSLAVVLAEPAAPARPTTGRPASRDPF